MSEALTGTVFLAIAGLASAIVYLHKMIIKDKDKMADCMEKHARTDEENKHLRQDLLDIKRDVHIVKKGQNELASTVASLPSPAPQTVVVVSDTKVVPPT